MNIKPNQLSNSSLVWLMISLTLAALPHFSYQPLWVSSIFLAMIGWRAMAIKYHWPLPNRQYKSLIALQLLIALATGFLLFNSYGNLIGRDAGTALLIVMLGLKVIEIHNERDYYLSCFLGYFLVVTNFLYSQSIATAGLMFIVVILMTNCLISVNDNKQVLSKQKQLKMASKLLLQSIPLMLVLFVFFPRIAGPLWGLPQDAHTAKTGIDNKMTLGRISQLIQSDAVAFRVKFDNEIPPAAERYWRGPVLWQTDGTTWTELQFTSKNKTPTITSSGQGYPYTITIEPHNKHWIFALDFPSNLAEVQKTIQTHDGKLQSIKPINQRVQYKLTSHTQFEFNANHDTHLDTALQLPEGQHPRTKQLAQQWLQTSSDPQQLVQRALQYFNQQNFFYTLSPPLLTGDTIDNFLFESRRGFCEHYAASFTVLMRAVGIPTRIVTGYQGGDINPVDDYLIVRQQDAHAWTEVWLAGQGWVRVDPTASVAQDRIELGMDNIMPSAMRAPLFFASSSQLIDAWQSIRNNWDAINNAWNRSILAYGPELQKLFLSSLGMTSPDWQKMTIYLVVLFNIVLLIIVTFMLYNKKNNDPIVATYQQFCKKLARFDIKRDNHEGPLSFANKTKTLLPHYQANIETITQLYIDLRYGRKQRSLNDLKQAVKRFKPKKTMR
jgi:protein-glutamine gamma-glutamyltransferase